ncbi:MAG: radical SAM protein [Candidatus Omnitrophica bacterium]|nr:radical SAM protein [Candidatus Omnitrophota bacterium]
MSLGIDPLSTTIKYCNFACPYCQLGGAKEYGLERKVFISPAALAAEIKELPADCHIDYLTFSGNGEPTLAANLGELIKAARSVRPNKVAVITNATLLTEKDVQADLCLADLVLLKLDAGDEASFKKVNAPAPGMTLAGIVDGIKAFSKIYKGKLALQMMFVGHNKGQAAQMAAIARQISPDEVQLNTPLRPSPVRALSEAEMLEVKKPFVAAGLKVLSVYEEEKKEYKPFDAEATVKRHGRYNS